ncbi:peptidylprolyl isomerase [Sandaracinus amylolyticus]|uniref:peptidylprolyl isomerase n=1 Tax=Sandaracinus amylolyticus TaxID=927083 RepID=A0A0F6W0J0_9BACT|nr:peptidylprolyl isomerase [Sandaracinus amylolyticus]AKF04336.1 Peptidyl-prolyl cis-trans isomerase PpiD [Sandaracinus amylolyticus]
MRAFLALSCLLALACSSPAAEPAPPPPAPTEAPPPAVVAPDTRATPDEASAAEACARVIVVAWSGAAHAPASITRTQDEARARAEQLRTRLVAGSDDLATLARTESDAASSGPRGGLLGTYTREDWPAAHEPIRDAVWALRTGAISDVLEAPYGYVVAQRCAVEHVHTRHVLVRYAGARNAGPEITRTRGEAEARARELLARAQAPGADFAAIAREESEDASAERGGDLGVTGRGRLAQAFEDAAYALDENAIAGPIETEFGFHVIQRLPE